MCSSRRFVSCSCVYIGFLIFSLLGTVSSGFLESDTNSRTRPRSSVTKSSEQFLDQDIGFRFSWHMTQEAINLTLKIDKLPFVWFSFGFVQDDFEDIVVLKLKGKKIYFKDCYLDPSQDDVIHVDSQQDFHLVKSSMKSGLAVTFHRKLNTNDDHDVIVKPGKVEIVWAYGSQKSSRLLSQEYWENRVTGKIVIKPAKKHNVPEESTVNNVQVHQSTQKPKMVTHTIGKAKSHSKQSGHGHTQGPTEAQNLVTHQGVSPAEPKRNCTVIIQKNADWYEMLRMRENSVYYAIIGSAALLTGIIVLMLACCCAKKKVMVSPRQKVAFYKVDDYDDEQIEFLREKEDRR